MAEIIHITDLLDPRLADFVSLTDVSLRKKLEPEHGLYMAESLKVITRALAAGHMPRSVLLQEQWLEELLPLFEKYSCPLFVGSAELVEELTGFDVHRGALAAMERPPLPALESLLDGAQTLVVLEDIVDHTNVGAIFRTVAGLGADAVLISPRCADPYYRRAVRVSMGTVLQVPWTRIPDWPQTTTILHNFGFEVIAFALDDRAIDLNHFVATPGAKSALVFGAEGDGLSPQALVHADHVVKIPMRHGVDSLNVAAASAVALYAFVNS